MMLATVKNIIFVPQEGVVQSIPASALPAPPNGQTSHLDGSWRSVAWLFCFFKKDLCRGGCGFVSLVVVKYRVTQQSKRRLYLELLLEPGSKPWYVVVVVIVLKKKGGKMSRILTDNTQDLHFHASILSPHHCLSSLVLQSAPRLTGTEPSRDSSFRQDFKIKHRGLARRFPQYLNPP